LADGEAKLLLQILTKRFQFLLDGFVLFLRATALQQHGLKSEALIELKSQAFEFIQLNSSLINEFERIESLKQRNCFYF